MSSIALTSTAPARGLRIGLASAMLGFLLTAVGFATTNDDADAAVTCNSTRALSDGRGGFVFIPTGDGTVKCQMTVGTVDTKVPSPVMSLQDTLNQCYNAGLLVDGRFGTKTRDALKRAQSEAGVKADGIYGSETRSAIDWYWGEASSKGRCHEI